VFGVGEDLVGYPLRNGAVSDTLRARQSRGVFLRFDVGAKDCIHAGEVPLAVGLEPVDDIAVEAQVNQTLTGRNHDAGGLPEIRAEGFRCGGLRAGLVLALFAQGFDLTQSVSHDGRFLFHLGRTHKRVHIENARAEDPCPGVFK